MKRTSLYETHLKFGGRLIDFGGWELPVQYTSIIAEHTAVREAAGLFDASHMGEIRVKGKGAKAALNRLLTNDLSAYPQNKAMYSLMLNANGGTIDDLIVYIISDEEFFCVVNAGNTEKDFKWIYNNIHGNGIAVTNESCDYSLIALQGPLSFEILQKLTEIDLSEIPFFGFKFGNICDTRVLISKTGYTGENGFELYLENSKAAIVWEAIMSDGRTVCAGLGARDTLRLEAALPLYGHELTETVTPLEAGLSRFVKFDKDDFIGKAALLKSPPNRFLEGIDLIDKGVPREGCKIIQNGKEIGTVTSGTHSPTLKKGIAMALLNEKLSIDTEVNIEIRDKEMKAKVVKLPFYRKKKS